MCLAQYARVAHGASGGAATRPRSLPLGALIRLTRTPSCPIAISLFFSCFVTFAIGILFDPADMARPDNLDERARHVAWADWGSNYGR